MGMLKMKIGVIFSVLAMAIMLSSACGPEAAPSPAQPKLEPGPAPGPAESAGNQPPEISSLTSAQTAVLPLSIIEVRCVATDPDGDAISYEWSTTGGSFTGTGPTVSWVAPEHYGDYNATVTVRDDKGGVAKATINLSVVSNQNPQILSLTAEPNTVLCNGKSTITCVATDPDGDTLSYGWSANYGSITGVGDAVIWIAPDRVGEFTITATVDDGEGGQYVADVSVAVVTTQGTATFTPVLNETGRVSSSGDKDTSRTMAGDDVNDVAYHAFWSFDLYSLRGTDVQDAKLTFTTKGAVVGEPFDKNTGLGGLHIVAVRYEQGQLPVFDPEIYSELASAMWEPPTEDIDVTKLVRNIGLGVSASDRLQVEASFIHQTNGNHIAEYVEWLSAVLTVTYTEK
ncbi:MAG: PKD domain-containing protein [Dehalococcoidia bacterium]|nr:PKD domain-containing protein [Dehalococcoidia bacterium]